MLNRSASLAMSTSILKTLPGKLDIKRHSPGILFIYRKGLQYNWFETKKNIELIYTFPQTPLKKTINQERYNKCSSGIPNSLNEAQVLRGGSTGGDLTRTA